VKLTVKRPAWLHLPRREHCDEPAPVPAAGGVLLVFRHAALWAVALLISAATSAAFAESYRGLFEWAERHHLTGIWSALFPVQVDVFIAVGELVLFVAMVDGWRRRDRLGAWMLSFIGLAVSVAGNIGHLGAADLQSRGTAAVPPVAAFAALWLGLGVIKRVIATRKGTDEIAQPEAIGEVSPEPVADTIPSPVPNDAESAAEASLRATLTAGNPLSLNQLQNRFNLTRKQATDINRKVLAASNGHAIEDAEEGA
jgi:hypothetical protein